MNVRFAIALSALFTFGGCAVDADSQITSSEGHEVQISDTSAEPELSLVDYENPAVRDFLLDALAGRTAPDATITYDVLVVDEDGQQGWISVTMGVSDEAPSDAYTIELMSEYTLNWCEVVGPSVSKTIWATSCSKSTAMDTAKSWAVSLADDTCEATISMSGGDAACAPDNFDDNICVSGGGSYTSICQHGSDTACGVWPLRHAQWKATYAYSGECGYNCSTDPFTP